jgi:hypothetical protein
MLAPMPTTERPTRREHIFWIGSLTLLGAFGAYTHEHVTTIGAALGLFLWLVAIPRQKDTHS